MVHIRDILTHKQARASSHSGDSCFRLPVSGRRYGVARRYRRNERPGHHPWSGSAQPSPSKNPGPGMRPDSERHPEQAGLGQAAFSQPHIFSQVRIRYSVRPEGAGVR